jgi:hypothetical protein
MSAFSVVSYTENPVYVVFAAAGSWIGAYISGVQPVPAPTRTIRRVGGGARSTAS